MIIDCTIKIRIEIVTETGAKQTCDPPDSKLIIAAMDTCNLKGVISPLPSSEGGIGYLLEGVLMKGKWERESGLLELVFIGRNETTEAVTSRLHSVRVWYLSGRSGPFSCYSRV
ncbi:hypothetical protein EVAR_37455_1 [Eumeta japonica]|uniref:Uncharacterized protein n=1 Tax=Eumeta variegata TaxID=151549 RepID=A0A4C1X2H4_EUMVA|nr:hypothetical protein EVAR_37455_1 [Eumeta japonica]